MRFSIRWLLAVTAYVALVAAAFAAWSDLLLELVWTVTLIAICYATVVAFVGRGRRQAIAAGFIAMSVIHACCMIYARRTPVRWIYYAFGYYVGSDFVAGTDILYEAGTNAQGQAILADTFFANVRVANAVGTLVAGLVGCVIGAVAWRTCAADRKEQGS